MTVPTSRQWLTSLAIATRIVDYLINTDLLSSELRDSAISIAEQAFKSTDYQLEFKVLRLTEKLKNRIADGDLFNTSCTTCGEVRSAFKDIYTLDVLEQFDEEGNLIQ